jgi:hypothetical protein
VQIAHGGHKGRALEALQVPTQIGNGVNDMHAENPCSGRYKK